MERLTKKELRALLESIKECYPNCDLKTFSQRVVSRLSKIVPTENVSHTVVAPGLLCLGGPRTLSTNLSPPKTGLCRSVL